MIIFCGEKKKHKLKLKLHKPSLGPMEIKKKNELTQSSNFLFD